MENKGKTKHFTGYVIAVLLLVSFLLNLAAWCSVSFSDFYVMHIFPLWVETYGRFSGLFPISIGELLLYMAVPLVITFVVFLEVWVGFFFVNMRKDPEERKPCPAFIRVYLGFVLLVTAIVALLLTLNCYILYHATPFSSRYGLTGSGRSYSAEELGILRDYVVNHANALAEEMERDEQGQVITDTDLEQQAVEEMKRLGESYSILSGYYPKPKKLGLSWFFSQQYIMGYYFPFSMEANYNRDMYITNMPVTMCHELSHLKGNIYEDEANFIGYLACVDSEDKLFRYSAYLSVIGYINSDFKKAVGADSEEYKKHPAISEKVKQDRVFLTEEAWAQVEETSLLNTETVQKASNAFLETNLMVNGVSQGIISYSEVVQRLLEYYEGKLY